MKRWKGFETCRHRAILSARIENFVDVNRRDYVDPQREQALVLGLLEGFIPSPQEKNRLRVEQAWFVLEEKSSRGLSAGRR